MGNKPDKQEPPDHFSYNDILNKYNVDAETRKLLVDILDNIKHNAFWYFKPRIIHGANRQHAIDSQPKNLIDAITRERKQFGPINLYDIVSHGVINEEFYKRFDSRTATIWRVIYEYIELLKNNAGAIGSGFVNLIDY